MAVPAGRMLGAALLAPSATISSSMATSALPGTPTPAYTPRSDAPRPADAAAASDAGVPGYIMAILAASALVVVGIIWDISWHMTIGRDGLLSPPHLATYAGGAIVGVTCGWLALRTTFAGSDAERGRSVRIWGFRAPFGAWVCVWGAFAMATSAPFDAWWHDAYGLDVQIISPPHTVLLLGMVGIVLGAMLMTAAYRNQVAESRRRVPERIHLVAVGLLLSMLAVFATEYTSRWNMHGPVFYRISAVVFGFVLVSAARASRLAWPATTVALVYMAVRIGINWTLMLFPGEPRLGPIFTPVTHFVPMEFPLLLAAPAFAIDLVMRRVRNAEDAPDARRAWALSAALAVAFVLAFLAAQWPFADFLQSPAARNWFFHTDRFAYMESQSGDYARWRYSADDLAIGAAGWARGLLLACLFATVSARAGLGFGRWMRELRR